MQEKLSQLLNSAIEAFVRPHILQNIHSKDLLPKISAINILQPDRTCKLHILKIRAKSEGGGVPSPHNPSMKLS